MLTSARRAKQRDRAASEYSAKLGDALLRHRARIAERAARIEAERSSKIKSQFIANMSHELRTPLNAIIGFSGIMQKAEKEPLPPEQVREYATYVNEAAEHLLSVINSILSISKIQSGAFMLDIQPMAIDEVLQSAMRFMEVKARECGVALSAEINHELPLIEADPVRMKQVFTNLISNAVKYTKEGGSVMVSTEMLADDRVLVAVSDTGIGMNEEEVAIALTPFGQVESEYAKSQEGTGLGLAITRALVEQHGGALEISSVKGQGTVVATILPVKAQTRN